MLKDVTLVNSMAKIQILQSKYFFFQKRNADMKYLKKIKLLEKQYVWFIV